MCWNCEEYVDPNTHLCYMKLIVNEDEEWQGECKKKQKPRQKRGRLSEEMTDNEVEENDEDEEGQEYLFFDIETRQDDGQHIANCLIVQDQTGFETVFKGDDCVGQFGTWLLDGSSERKSNLRRLFTTR